MLVSWVLTATLYQADSGDDNDAHSSHMMQASSATLLTIGMHFRPAFLTPAYTDDSGLVPADLLDYGGYNILFTAELDSNNVLRAPLTGELVNLARTFVVNRFQAVRTAHTLLCFRSASSCISGRNMWPSCFSLMRTSSAGWHQRKHGHCGPKLPAPLLGCSGLAYAHHI